MSLFNGWTIHHARQFRKATLTLFWIGLIIAPACGGQVAESESALTGGGQGATTMPSMGSGTSTGATGATGATTIKPTAAVCYGEPGAIKVNVCQTFNLGTFAKSDASCKKSLPIRDTMKLNPALAAIYFDGENGTTFVVPYVGSQADCAAATSLGGWYATNTSGGNSEVGLCGCTCNAAHESAVKLAVDCAGMGGF